jgi:DNA polymerase III subunit delta
VSARAKATTSPATARSAPIHLMKGSEPAVLGDTLRKLVDDLVGDGDRSLVVEELDADSYTTGDGDGAEIAVLVNAAQTPPFLTDSRVVVARHAGLFGTNDAVASLVAYLDAPLDTTTLVLVWEKGPRQSKLPAVPKPLAAALKASGGVEHDTSPPAQKGRRGSWIDDQVKEAGLSLSPGARKLIEHRVGEDVGRVGALLRTLHSTFGAGAKLDETDIEPYLGEHGGVAPWDLTDAIDAGDSQLALERLHRLLGAGERNALGILYTLHGHYRRMLALDGADVTDEKAAAELLGISPYPAKKALGQGRRLGSERVAASIRLIAGADLDLRGMKAWSPELVLEVLVARLAYQARSSR